MKALFSKMNTLLGLEESEVNTIIKYAHPTKFTSKQVMDRLAGIYSANFEQDVIDAIKDLEETDGDNNS